MPYPSLTFADLLDIFTRQELEQFISLLQGYLSSQHKDDGTHEDITADSVTVTGDVDIEGQLTVDAPDLTTGGIPEIPVTITNAGSNSGAVPLLQLTSPDGRAALRVGVDGEPNRFGMVWSDVTTPVLAFSAPNVTDMLYTFGGGVGGSSVLEVSVDGLKERARSFAMGEAIPVAYTLGDYTCDGGDTWTVAAGDMTTFNYALVGDRCFVDLALDATSITSGTATTLSVKIPGSLTSTYRVGAPCIIFNASASVFETGSAQVEAAGTTINIVRPPNAPAFSVSANLTFLRVSINFPVS